MIRLINHEKRLSDPLPTNTQPSPRTPTVPGPRLNSLTRTE